MSKSKVVSFFDLGSQVQSAIESKNATLFEKAQYALQNWKGFPYADKMSEDSKSDFRSGVVSQFASTHTVVHYIVTNKSGTKVKRLSLRDKSTSGAIQIDPSNAYAMSKSDLKALDKSPASDARAVYLATADCRAMVQRVTSDALNDLCEAGMTPDQLEKAETARKRKGRGSNKPFVDKVRSSMDGLSTTAKVQHNAGNLPFTLQEWQTAVNTFLTTLGLKQ